MLDALAYGVVYSMHNLGHATLREARKTMTAVIVKAASVSTPLLGANVTEADMTELLSISDALRESLSALYSVVVLQQPEHSPTFPVDPR
jgi:chromate reductase